MSSNKEMWGSRLGLVLAMAGNAVGLGNFLRFPVQAIQNGGGAFIIPYLVCFLLMGIPLLLVEWSMGRFSGLRGNHAIPFILGELDRRWFWKYIGVFGIFTNVAVAAYYCYLESWTLGYIWYSISGAFSGQSAEQVSAMFSSYVGLENSTTVIFWVICLVLNTWILSRSLAGGVEVVAKIGMPLLIVFAIFLAWRGLTLKAGADGAVFDGMVGANFLWTPDFSTIWQPKVWLAAAGQIFFTLAVGMGSVQCYASFMKKNDDLPLNAMTAGWTNEFVEVVLGASILIPISVGYLGIDKVVEMTRNGGLGLGFRTFPYLFQQWGDVFAALAGVAWFGLLFFAGITSSLAMGMPCLTFLRDEFGWRRETAAWAFGATIFVLGIPTVLYFNEGVFDEFDYWAGTVSLVVFAFAESILFAWVWGMDKGWAEINRGADIRLPRVFYFIIKYITPLILGWVFFSNLPGIWEKMTNAALKIQLAAATDPLEIQKITDQMFLLNMSRLLLLAVFLGISWMVFVAHRRRVAAGRA